MDKIQIGFCCRNRDIKNYEKALRKNEVSFAILMIVIYVVGTVFSEIVTAFIGLNKLVPAIFHMILSVALLWRIVRNGLLNKYGPNEAELLYE